MGFVETQDLAGLQVDVRFWIELLCAIGLFNYFNRFNNALQMEPTKPGEGGCVAPAPEVVATK